MIIGSIRSGLKGPIENLRLTLLLWALSLVLAAVAALPAWRWLGSAFNLAPESDRFLDGFSLGLLRELGQYDRSPVWGMVFAGMFGVAAVVLLANPLIAGGILETLTSSDRAPFLHRFFRGAGRFYARFLLLLAYTLAAGTVILGLVSLAFGRAANRAMDSGWEPAAFAVLGLGIVLAAAVAAFFSLALDFARIRMALDDDRKTLRIWLSALRFTCVRFAGAFGILVFLALLFGMVLAGYFAFGTLVPARTWVFILLTVAVQQVVVVNRVAFRIALVRAELRYFELCSRTGSGAALPESPPTSMWSSPSA